MLIPSCLRLHVSRFPSQEYQAGLQTTKQWHSKGLPRDDLEILLWKVNVHHRYNKFSGCSACGVWSDSHYFALLHHASKCDLVTTDERTLSHWLSHSNGNLAAGIGSLCRLKYNWQKRIFTGDMDHEKKGFVRPLIFIGCEITIGFTCGAH